MPGGGLELFIWHYVLVALAIATAIVCFVLGGLSLDRDVSVAQGPPRVLVIEDENVVSGGLIKAGTGLEISEDHVISLAPIDPFHMLSNNGRTSGAPAPVGPFEPGAIAFGSELAKQLPPGPLGTSLVTSLDRGPPSWRVIPAPLAIPARNFLARDMLDLGGFLNRMNTSDYNLFVLGSRVQIPTSSPGSILWSFTFMARDTVGVNGSLGGAAQLRMTDYLPEGYQIATPLSAPARTFGESWGWRRWPVGNPRIRPVKVFCAASYVSKSVLRIDIRAKEQVGVLQDSSYGFIIPCVIRLELKP